MASKRKKRQVPKVSSATPAPQKSDPSPKPSSAEALIKLNGDLIESLISHEGWVIVEDLIDEGVASVIGRKTNGYYYNGAINTTSKDKQYLTGYLEALTQLYNRIKEFIKLRDQLKENKKKEEVEKSSPVYNPFMEGTEFED